MTVRKLYLISPREPSGVTWLINCLLVSGIKTYRNTVGSSMWVRSGAHWTLNPLEDPLKKWLPCLSETERFAFRADVEVEWAHVWPTGMTAGARVIYFVRDPRDALFSRYRRESPDATFKEFLAFPDEHSLLDKIETWNLFNEAWLSQPELRVFRFEDYKHDALATLRTVVDFCAIDIDEPALSEAVRQSDFAHAVAGEKRYRALRPEDTQVINRASQVGSWKDPSLAHEVAEIASRSAGLMARYGYLAAPEQALGQCSYQPQSTAVRFYRSLAVPSGFWNRPYDGREQFRANAVAELAMALDARILDKFHMQPYEQWLLVNGLREFLPRATARTAGTLKALQGQLGGAMGTEWRVKEFVLSRGWWIPAFLRNWLRRSVRAMKAMAGKVFE